jgi:hypothetical protein
MHNEDAAYARSRESGRLGGILTFGALVLVLGLGVAFTIAGPARIFMVALTLAILAFFAIIFARTPNPAALTPLVVPIPPGSWPASVPASAFPELLQHHPRLRSASELPGTVTFAESGVTWTPGAQTRRSFGVDSLIWDSTWTPLARRLRGFGSLVQLTMAGPDAQQSVTLWMRRAADFQIPRPHYALERE